MDQEKTGMNLWCRTGIRGNCVKSRRQIKEIEMQIYVCAYRCVYVHYICIDTLALAAEGPWKQRHSNYNEHT